MSEILTCAEARRIDSVAIEQFGISGLVLMENAGRGATDLLQRLGINGTVLVCCGGGNNAGDGFVLARHLMVRNIPVITWFFVAPEKLSGDASTNYHVLTQCHANLVDFRNATWKTFEIALQHADWVVDALLGTGTNGAPREPIAKAIRYINLSGKKVLSLDLPSGLDADSGVAADPTFKQTIPARFMPKKEVLSSPKPAPMSEYLKLPILVFRNITGLTINIDNNHM